MSCTRFATRSARRASRVSHWPVKDHFRNWDSYRGAYNYYTPGLDDNLFEKVGSFVDMFHYESGSVHWRPDEFSWVAGDGLKGRGWHAEPTE